MADTIHADFEWLRRSMNTMFDIQDSSFQSMLAAIRESRDELRQAFHVIKEGLRQDFCEFREGINQESEIEVDSPKQQLDLQVPASQIVDVSQRQTMPAMIVNKQLPVSDVVVTEVEKVKIESVESDVDQISVAMEVLGTEKPDSLIHEVASSGEEEESKPEQLTEVARQVFDPMPLRTKLWKNLRKKKFSKTWWFKFKDERSSSERHMPQRVDEVWGVMISVAGWEPVDALSAAEMINTRLEFVKAFVYENVWCIDWPLAADEERSKFLKEIQLILGSFYERKILSCSIRDWMMRFPVKYLAQFEVFEHNLTTESSCGSKTVSSFSSSEAESKFHHVNEREFLELSSILDSKRVLLKVEIPSWTAPSGDDTEFLFERYRAAPHSIGNALPYENAAFFALVSRQEPSRRGVMVDKCLLAFGSYGGDHSIRATEVENLLTGKLLSYSVLYEAVGLLRGIIVLGKNTSHPEYRKSLAVGFLFDCFYPMIESVHRICSLDSWEKHSNGHVNPAKALPCLTSAQQVLESNEVHPVGEAVIKVGAALRASVFAVLTFKDIPKQGQDIGSKTLFGPGPLFADELTQCAGQRISLVLADTQKHADMAAKLAVVEYDTKNIEEPILIVEDAVKRSSFFEVHPMFYPEPVGDVFKGMEEAERKILSDEFRLGSQYFFYKEPQTALALPDDNNRVWDPGGRMCSYKP